LRVCSKKRNGVTATLTSERDNEVFCVRAVPFIDKHPIKPVHTCALKLSHCHIRVYTNRLMQTGTLRAERSDACAGKHNPVRTLSHAHTRRAMELTLKVDREAYSPILEVELSKDEHGGEHIK
jgi:hypothetical protein